MKNFFVALFLVMSMMLGGTIAYCGVLIPIDDVAPDASPELQIELQMLKYITEEIRLYTDGLILDHVLVSKTFVVYEYIPTYIVNDILIKKYNYTFAEVGVGVYGSSHDGYAHPLYVRVVIKGKAEIPSYVFDFPLKVSEFKQEGI